MNLGGEKFFAVKMERFADAAVNVERPENVTEFWSEITFP